MNHSGPAQITTKGYESPQPTPTTCPWGSPQDTIDKQDLIDRSPFFWYSPVPDLEGMRKKLTQDRYKDYSNSKGKTALGATPASNPSAMEIKIPAQRKRLSLTQQRSTTKGSTQARSDEQMVLYSGECSFKFKFRLIGIERLNVLFEELSEFVATENKDTKPRNVQLDNKEAVYNLPDDDGRLAKMAAWIKKKVGMR